MVGHSLSGSRTQQPGQLPCACCRGESVRSASSAGYFLYTALKKRRGIPAKQAHLVEYPLLAREHVRARRLHLEAVRIREDRGEKRGLVRRQSSGGLAEVLLRGGLHTEDPVAELGNVQVRLEDAALGPAGFHEQREIGF